MPEVSSAALVDPAEFHGYDYDDAPGTRRSSWLGVGRQTAGGGRGRLHPREGNQAGGSDPAARGSSAVGDAWPTSGAEGGFERLCARAHHPHQRERLRRRRQGVMTEPETP